MSADGIVVFTLGGTIAMTGHDGGVVARLGGRDLLAGIDGLAEAGGIEVRDLRAVPSADLSFADILDAGFGVGHVSGVLATGLGDLAAAMPVVLATRIGAGPVLASTYAAAFAGLG